MQHIADSSDDQRRNRGRRGLEVLNRLRKNARIPVRIADMDIEDVYEVDDKLVLLAKQLHCPVLTNDFNLNRVAEIQGVPIPVNPMRGEPFNYELRDGRAVLSAPLEPDDTPERALRYEIEITK